MTYTFTATTPGTHAYYSGTQGDLQVEMGLYGAIIVLPDDRSRLPARPGVHGQNRTAQSSLGRRRFPARGGRLRPSDSLLRPRVSVPVLRDGSEDSPAGGGAGRSAERARRRSACSLNVATEPYHPPTS